MPQDPTRIDTAPGGPDRFLSFAAARKVVGISRSKIYLLIDERAFPKPVKVGRNNYFSERELQSWMQSQLDRRPSASVEV
ncbi:MAG: AlpA family phage regulatory protein [Hyphomicrobiales bacterium]|nr:AlpA family phage regulatory protein [Hyphomicrobiales bacterium]